MEPKKAYRIGKTEGAPDLSAIYEMLPARFDSREEAVAHVRKFRADRYTTYVLIPPDEVRGVVASIKAKTVIAFLKGRGFQVACDYDDARARLLKLASVADKSFEQNHSPAPRKGFLQTEVGMEYMFEVIHLLAEKRRVQYHTLTPEEADRSHTYDRYANQRISYRDMLAREFEAEARTKAVEMAMASIHKDEY